jgi:hypothetical protein
MLVLEPNKTVKQYSILSQTLGSVKYEELLDISSKDELDIITYYQSASYFYKEHINKWKAKN